MLVVSLAIALVLSASNPSEPSSLIEELGSSRYARREAAEAVLERLGGAVVPALRAAQASHDPEIRARSAAILGRIEDRLLTQPTLVALDFRDVTPAEAIAAINARTGLELAPTPRDHPAWSGTRLDCRRPAPLPFWTALDVLCEAGHIQYAFGMPGQPGAKETSFPIYPGEPTSLGPVSDSGPFRVQLASIHAQSDLTFARNPVAIGGPAPTNDEPTGRGQPSPRRQFYVQLVLAAEPRLAVAQDGPAGIIEATDGRGNSLLVPPGPEVIQRSSGYLGINASPSLQVRVDLARADPTAEQIRLLRGVIPVVISARKPGATAVRLDEAVGKSFRDDEAAVEIIAVRPAQAGRGIAIDVAVRAKVGLHKPGTNPGEARARRELNPRQFEILDARGEAMTWFPSSSTYEGEATRTTIVLPTGESSAPAAIRFHVIARARVEVPFMFRDVAMP